ncbi:PP2C family protein-serine/threonine phosphatase [Streptacidiphilus monticola]
MRPAAGAPAAPRLADWVVVDLADEQGEVWRTTVATCLPDGRVRRRHDLEGPMPPVTPVAAAAVTRAARRRGLTGRAGGVRGAPDSGIAVIQHDLFAVTGIRSAAIAPIRDNRVVLGAVTIGRTEPGSRYTVQDLSLLEDISRRAGLALSNSRLYQRQRRIAETMQRHLLPQLPDVPGLQMAARYLPAPEASQVGGDWYDAFTLPGGDTAVVIGDVIGHDLDAAAGMAQLRNMLRALTWALEEVRACCWTGSTSRSRT